MSDFKEMMKELEVLLRGTGNESFTMLLKLPDVLGRILAFLQSEDMRHEEHFCHTEEKLESLIATLRDYLMRADDRQQLGRSLVEERARAMHLERVNAPLKNENAQLKGETAQLKGETAQLKGETAQLKGENAQLKGENARLRVSPDEDARIADSFSRLIQSLQAAEAALASLKQSRIVETGRRLSSKVPEIIATARGAAEQAQKEIASLQHEIKTLLTGRNAVASEHSMTVVLDYPVKPRVRDWRQSAGGGRLRELLGKFEQNYRQVIECSKRMETDFATISVSDRDDVSPYWHNDWFPPLDAIALCALLCSVRPARYVEIGSGHSTRFARWAIETFALPTRIVSIDPAPRLQIDRICDERISKPLEDLDDSFFSSLSSNDFVFIDGSHRSFQNSDVTVFFTELLPILPPGAVYGLHDIFLPADYIPEFVERFYNEQYLLAAYLFGGGGGDEILFSSAYVGTFLPDELVPLETQLRLQNHLKRGGGGFWARRAANSQNEKQG